MDGKSKLSIWRAWKLQFSDTGTPHVAVCKVRPERRWPMQKYAPAISRVVPFFLSAETFAPAIFKNAPAGPESAHGTRSVRTTNFAPHGELLASLYSAKKCTDFFFLGDSIEPEDQVVRQRKSREKHLIVCQRFLRIPVKLRLSDFQARLTSDSESSPTTNRWSHETSTFKTLDYSTPGKSFCHNKLYIFACSSLEWYIRSILWLPKVHLRIAWFLNCNVFELLFPFSNHRVSPNLARLRRSQ